MFTHLSQGGPLSLLKVKLLLVFMWSMDETTQCCSSSSSLPSCSMCCPECKQSIPASTESSAWPLQLSPSPFWCLQSLYKGLSKWSVNIQQSSVTYEIVWAIMYVVCCFEGNPGWIGTCSSYIWTQGGTLTSKGIWVSACKWEQVCGWDSNCFFIYYTVAFIWLFWLWIFN